VRANATKTASTRIVEIVTRFKDDDYALAYVQKSFLSETGHLKVFELKCPSGPDFSGRWDEKPSALDIDVLGVDRAARTSFKNSRDGSSGHHTIQVTADAWKFAVNIIYRGRRIFEGTVHIALDQERAFKSGLKMGGSFTC